jgi:hypothetical protein
MTAENIASGFLNDVLDDVRHLFMTCFATPGMVKGVFNVVKSIMWFLASSYVSFTVFQGDMYPSSIDPAFALRSALNSRSVTSMILVVVFERFRANCCRQSKQFWAIAPRNPFLNRDPSR